MGGTVGASFRDALSVYVPIRVAMPLERSGRQRRMCWNEPRAVKTLGYASSASHLARALFGKEISSRLV